MKQILALLMFLGAGMLSSCGGGNNNTAATTNTCADTVKNPGPKNDSLRRKLADYIHARNMNIGVAVLCIETGDTLSVNGHEHYALMSVCKFPQAIALLHLVDEGKIAPDAAVHVTKEDFSQPTRSSLQKDHPKTPFDLTIPEAFSYSIGQSDNVTSNIIFAMEGGPGAVEAYIHSLGIADIGVQTDYKHMRNDSLYRNWITPVAAANLLNKFYTGKILSDSSRAILWHAMVTAPNGRDRLAGQLPEGTIVGHKTGTSGRDSSNVTTAYNDIGIMELPDGRHIAVAVFVAKTSLADDGNAATIADIGKMVWDHFMGK